MVTTHIPLIFGLILNLAGIASAKNELWGRIAPGDILVGRDEIDRDSPWLSRNREYIEYPPKLDVGPLSAIRVIDRADHPDYATATLKSGGPAHSFASIRLLSKLRKPIHMTIEYYIPAQNALLGHNVPTESPKIQPTGKQSPQEANQMATTTTQTAVTPIQGIPPFRRIL
ncbi:uncharacterized protein LOC142241007 [Haematobia irritans]|uniref:uncharacterized protein LOC142241007 n=1 Tax=Haematobia irritans TaxID=7368 RepID=UPI003F503518